MCINTVKKKKFLILKILKRGAPPNVPKLDVSGVKDTAKTYKD